MVTMAEIENYVISMEYALKEVISNSKNLNFGVAIVKAEIGIRQSSDMKENIAKTKEAQSGYRNIEEFVSESLIEYLEKNKRLAIVKGKFLYVIAGGVVEDGYMIEKYDPFDDMSQPIDFEFCYGDAESALKLLG